VADFKGALGRVNQSEVDDIAAGAGEALGDTGNISLEAVFKTWELLPVCCEAYAKQADAQGSAFRHRAPCACAGSAAEGYRTLLS
jgi:hypothetical protein